MRDLRGVLRLSAVTLLALPTMAQDAAPGNPVSVVTPVVSLSEAGRVKVPMTGPPGVGVGLPMFCSAEGALFLRIITQMDFVDLVSISRDGKEIRHFDKAKINDVPNPTLDTFFVVGNDVYITADGFLDQEPATLIAPHKDGTTTQEKTIRYKGVKTYLAHFKTDGRYIGAVPLDIDFRLLRFGVFPTGEILVAGIKYGMGPQEPRLALLGANGQMLRYLQPDGDVQRESPQFKGSNNQQRSPLMLAETFLRMVLSSTIVPAENELVLVRPGSNPRIYAVSAGGEVVRQKFVTPGKYSLLGLMATPRGWIGQFSQPAGANGMKLMLFSFDRETGLATHEYQYPGPYGLGLACSDGTDFLFLREETEDSFTLVRAQPSGNAVMNSPQ